MEKNKKGFTLLEILLVVAAIGILAGIVILALNPNKQLGDTRNAQRWSDVNTVLNAVYQYSIDNSGSLPSDIDNPYATWQMIGTLTSGCDACSAHATEADCANLSELTTDEEYLTSIPYDPSGSGGTTLYYINKSGNGRVTVGACDPEQGEVIEVTR